MKKLLAVLAVPFLAASVHAIEERAVPNIAPHSAAATKIPVTRAPIVPAGIPRVAPTLATPILSVGGGAAAAPALEPAAKAEGQAARMQDDFGSSNNPGQSPEGASFSGFHAFDGGANLGGGGSFNGDYRPIDNFNGWWDAHTGQWETEYTKLDKVLNSFSGVYLRSPIARGTRQQLGRIAYGVDATGTYDSRSEGNSQFPLVILTRQMIQNASLPYIAARTAEQWAYFYFSNVATSAEKTYFAQSYVVRTFLDIAVRSIQNWPYRDADHAKGGNFVVWSLFSAWWNGHKTAANIPDGKEHADQIRRGPLFQAVMHDDAINADGAGRLTLHTLESRGVITGQQAVDGQTQFKDFVAGERNWLRAHGINLF